MSFDYFSIRRMTYFLEKLKDIFDTKADTSEVPSVIDNLTSTSTTDALSAKQGKALKDSIDELDIPSLLSDLSDVELTSLANGQIIKYNGTSQKWLNSDFVNGHNTYFGTSEPSVNLGQDNDIYIKVSNSDFGKSFRIRTTSTGGESASIAIDTIIEGIVTSTDGVNYRWPSRTYSDFTTNYYSSNWHVTITSNNVMEHNQGEDISWGWSVSKDMTLVINPPVVYGIYIKSRGTWIKISKDVEIVDNLTTNDATKALSAKQGKVLKDTIDGLNIPNELADLSDDSTHRLVTDTEKTTWNNKSDFDGAYNSLTGKPTLGTASAKDVPTSGDASTTQVVMGNDTRLTDARNAADVYSWAKAENKPTYNASEVGAIATTAKGSANGVAELDSTGKVPSSQLPSYVDDVVEGYYYNSKFYEESTHETEIPGESGKIYVDLPNDTTYRWSGTAFTQIKGDLVLGETSSTAYRGDRGKTAYDHSQTTSGNPHNVTKSDVGLGNVGNFKAVSTEANQGLTDTEKSNARTNIGAGTSSFSGSYTDLSDKPTLGTAAAKDVAVSGNASATQVVMGNDTRLTDSRTPTAHNQASNTINAMTGYSKPSSTSAIGTGDTLNGAIGKLEKGLDGKTAENPTFTEASSRANIASGESFATILGKIKKFFSDLKTVAFTGAYSDLTGTPTIPTVNNGTLTIQKNGTNVATFSANQSSNATANIQVVEPDSTIKSNTTGQFNTITGGILNSCVVNLEPKQSGSGTPSPSNVRPITGHSSVEVGNVGKNRLIPNLSSTSQNGVTLTVKADGTYVLNGTASATCQFYNSVSGLTPTKIGQSYIMTGCPSGGGNSTFAIRPMKTTSDYYSDDIGSGSTFTANASSVFINIIIRSGYVCNNLEFKPMLRLASDTDATFEPYQGQDVTVNLGGTYYGGTLDVVSGVFTGIVKGAEFDGSNDEIWSASSGTNFHQYYSSINDSRNSVGAIVNRFGLIGLMERGLKTGLVDYATDNIFRFALKDDELLISDVTAWRTWLSSNPIQVVYYLATPITIQLTPQQINTLIGENHLDVPLEGQSLDSAVYRELFAWDDVEDVIEPIADDIEYYEQNGFLSKNLLPMNLSAIKNVNTSGTWSNNVYTKNGITFTLNLANDGSIKNITINGTASANADMFVYYNANGLSDLVGKILNGCSNGSTSTYGLAFEAIGIVQYDGKDFTIPNNYATSKGVYIRVVSGNSVNNVPIYPMIRLASVSDNTFTPYAPSNNALANGDARDNTKIAKSDIVDNLTTNDATKVLSAKQGKVLQDTKVNISDIKDNLTSTDTNKPLSAKQGKVLDEKIDGLYTESTDNEPYTLRQGKGDMVDMELVGGSFAWNQLFNIANPEKTPNVTQYQYSGSSCSWHDTTNSNNFIKLCPSAPKGHKILLTLKNTCEYQLNIAKFDTGYTLVKSVQPNTSVSVVDIPVSTSCYYIVFCPTGWSGDRVLSMKDAMSIDLSYNASIADYIYNLEQATAGAGVAFFRKYFPKDYYAYDSGSIQSVCVSGRKVVGKNLLGYGITFPYTQNGITLSLNEKNQLVINGTVPNGFIISGVFYGNVVLGEQYHLSKQVISGTGSNLIITGQTPSTDSYYSYPSGTENIGGNKRNFCRFNLYFTTANAVFTNYTLAFQVEYGTTATTYEPYEEHVYPFDTTKQLRGIPSVVNNKLVYDGDIWNAKGITRKYILIHLGDYNWNYSSLATRFWLNVSSLGLKASATNVIPKMLCGKELVVDTWSNVTSNTSDKTIALKNDSSELNVIDTTYTDPATFKTAMNGVYLVAELATPTIESAELYQNPQRSDASGTEEFVDYGVESSTRDVSIPVGHNSTYKSSEVIQPLEDYVDGASADLDNKVQEKVAKTDIADNLTTNDATKVLSAKQGKALQDGKLNVSDKGTSVLEVVKTASRSTSTLGTWTAMCNSNSTGSPVLPISNKWWNVMSFNNWGESSGNWMSQLSIATQDSSGVWWRRNDSANIGIDASTWHRLAEGNAEGLAIAAVADKNGNDITTTYLPLSGGTLSDATLGNANALQIYRGASTKIEYNSASITNLPMSGYVWHDLFAFCKASTPLFYTSTDNVNWTEGTLDKSPFSQRENQSISIIKATGQSGARWVWNTNAFNWSSAEWLEVTFTMTGNGLFPNIDILFEVSPDGTTWTQHSHIYTTTQLAPVYMYIGGFGGSGYFRLTMTKDATDTTKYANLISIRCLTVRRSGQGYGKEIEYPYNWDKFGNITSISAGNLDLGATNNYWKNGYFTNINGTAVSNFLKTSDVKNDLTSTDTDKPLSAYQGNLLNKKVTYLGTLTGDVITTAKSLSVGTMTCYYNSNNPTNAPSDCKWGSYIIIKSTADICSFIYCDSVALASTRTQSLSTDTSLNWYISASKSDITEKLYKSGSFTSSTSASTTVTATNSAISISSTTPIDVYSDVFGLNVEAMSVSGSGTSATISITFPKTESAQTINYRVYVKTI